MSELNMEMAKNVYDTVCAALDKMKFNYTKHDEDMIVTLGYRGKDMNHDMLIAVDGEREVIQLIEKLPFRMNAENASNVACAVCYANEHMICGKFTYDMNEDIRFKVAQVYSGSLVSPDTIERLIITLAITVEQYDDKFMALNNGYIKAVDFKD